jgi:hypothetical protein
MRVWWSCALLGCIGIPVQAQDSGDLPNLLFEPVLIEILTPEAETPGASQYTAQELTSLPQGSATDLQAWLAARQTSATLPPDQLAADIAAYEASILELESTGGAFHPDLDEQLLALGSLLQQAGELDRAQDVLDRALHVSRVNGGLFGLQQIPIIERTIENHLARGDLVAADAQQEYLLYVQRKNFDSRGVDLLPALTRYAEWNLFAFRARLVPTIAPPSAENAEEQASAPEPRAEEDSDVMLNFRTGRLITAHAVYQSIINIVTSNFGIADSRLLNFERQLALTNYLYIATFGLEGQLDPSALFPDTSFASAMGSMEPGRPPLGFRQGRDSLERRVAYLNNEPETTASEKAQAKQDLADWMLMFSKRMGSLEIYQEAWRDMAAAGASAEELDALFNPPFPVEIPAYLNHPYTRQTLNIPADLALEYKGYIDIEFKLSRFGVPSAVSVISKSPTATPALESILVRNVRRAQYRPRIVDGAVRDNETMHVRFYFTY